MVKFDPLPLEREIFMSFPFCQIQEDCLWVLSQLQGPWKIPADALYEAIAQQGWQIRLGSLPAELFCACDAWKQTITISIQLQEQLNCPHLHREVLHWLLAVELGNIRLNSMAILEGKQDLACERLATDYASAFLLPRGDPAGASRCGLFIGFPAPSPRELAANVPGGGAFSSARSVCASCPGMLWPSDRKLSFPGTGGLKNRFWVYLL
jgi:hypothetical protein